MRFLYSCKTFINRSSSNESNTTTTALKYVFLLLSFKSDIESIVF